MFVLADDPSLIRALIAALPSPGFTRWTAQRKRGVVNAVDQGLLALDEACRRYGLTAEEIEEWRRGFGGYGIDGLKATSLGQRRRAAKRGEPLP